MAGGVGSAAGVTDLRKDRAFGALLGLAVGDAVGTTVEFRGRDTFAELTDMIGGGPFGLKPGEWTDDTSMALCLANSLIATNGVLDPANLLAQFVNWHRLGWNSVTGECFDIGNATYAALEAFSVSGSTVNNADEDLQANGSIMRLAPAVICAGNQVQAVELARAQGRTTHAASVPDQCCSQLAYELWACIETGELPQSVLNLRERQRGSIISSGHAPATLDAARWAVATTDSFRNAILAAANLGGDADTVAAVAGQIAGALYGKAGIPDDWLQRLAWRTDIEARASRLWALRA